jgi:hypothetical protein
MVFITVSASAPADSAARAFVTTPSWVSLANSGFAGRRRAAGGHDLLDGGGAGAEGEAAVLDVRAGEVELHGGHAGVLGDPLAEGREIADRLAGHGDEDRDAEVEGVEVLHEPLHARVLQPDGVDHAGRRLGDARRRVALPAAGVVVLGSMAP